MNPPIVEAAIERVVRNLTATGCKYAIQKPDGEWLLQGVEVKPPTKPKRQPKYTKKNHFAPTGYIGKVKAMAVGDVEVFAIGAFPRDAFRSSIAGAALAAFGKGNAQTCFADDTIQLLRLG